MSAMKNYRFAFLICAACLQVAAFAARETCDVLVVGGGAAGIAAALQSGAVVPE